MPSAAMPAATGGRFGPRRTTSSRDHSTRTGRPCSSASRRASPATGESPLAAEGAAVAEGEAGLAPGHAPRGVGLQVGRLDPGGAQRQGPVPGRDVDGWLRGTVVLRPWTLSARARASGSGRRHGGAPAGVGHGHQGVRRAPSSANPASPRTTAGPTRWATPPSRAARAAAAARSRTRAAAGRRASTGVRPSDGWAASRIVCQPVHRHRWASSAWSMRSSDDRSVERRQAHHDARGAEAALAAAAGDERVGPGVAGRRRAAPRGW